MNIRRSLLYLTLSMLSLGAIGCAPHSRSGPREDPALEYVKQLRGMTQEQGRVDTRSPMSQGAEVSWASDVSGTHGAPRAAFDGRSNMAPYGASGLRRDYNGPLSLGDPGLSASLWRESNDGDDFYRDYRAWRPFDLLTIIIDETAEGTKEADTDTKSESTLETVLTSFFGWETQEIGNVNTTTSSEFKGEGETTRKDSLKAKISAMVVEVLPSGIMRVAGKKIVAVNNEEQTIVISGLVRPRDISSSNEVMSSQIANMRIDYFGQGVISEKQSPGWLLRVLDKLWPL